MLSNNCKPTFNYALRKAHVPSKSSVVKTLKVTNSFPVRSSTASTIDKVQSTVKTSESQVNGDGTASIEYFQPMYLQDTITEMGCWDLFMANLQRDSTLHQDLLSFAVQPWVDRPWFKLNTHPALAAVFTDPSRASALAAVHHIINTVDHSLVEEQVTWFIKFARDVTTAPVVYTAMTNLSSRVFDAPTLDALDRTVAAALTPSRVDKVLATMQAAMCAEVPDSVVANTPEGGNPMVQGLFAGFQAFWTHERRAKIFAVMDARMTDEWFGRLKKVLHSMLPFSTQDNLEKLFATLDAALPTARCEALATAAGKLLGGEWAWALAERLDAALPAARLERLGAALDQAATPDRLDMLPQMAGSLQEVLTSAQVETLFKVLELVVCNEGRARAYAALLDEATGDAQRCDRIMALVERILTPATVGAMMDLTATCAATPERMTKVVQVCSRVWGGKNSDAKLARWLDTADQVLLGGDRTARSTLAFIDLAITPAHGSGIGLPNLVDAMEKMVVGEGRRETLGRAMDKATPSDLDALAKNLERLPDVLRVLGWLTSHKAMICLVNGLEAVLGEKWARKQVDLMSEAAASGTGSNAVFVGGALRIFLAAFFKGMLTRV